MRILLVEDNSDHRELMRLALTEYNATWQVEGVVSGKEALCHLAEGEAYDVVFLDYSLPGRDGLEVLEEIRRGEAPPPVVMVTGRGDEQVAVKAMKGGAYDYVVKGEGYLQRLPVVAHRAVEAHQLAVERKRAEEALRESEEKYRNLVENANEAIFVAQDGKLVFINPMTAMITGYSAEELTEKPFIEFIHPDDRNMVIDRHIRRLKGEDVPDRYSFRIIRRDGNIRWVELNAAVLINWMGQAATLNFMSEITERRQAEDALREKSHLNKTLLNAFPCVALLLRPQTREIISSNTAAVKVGALPGTHCFSTWGQRQDPCPWCLAPALWATGEAQHLEVEALGIFWDAYWIPVAEDLYMHFALDITERKRAEEALRESELRYKELFDNISSGVAIYEVKDDGNDFILKDFNKAGERLDGAQKADIIGKSIYQVRPGIKKFGLLNVFKRVWETGIPEHYPALLYEDDRLKKWFANYVYKIPTGQIVAVYEDVTERKRTEEKLIISQQQLRALATRLQKIREEERIMIAREIHDELGGGLTGLKIELSRLLRKRGDADQGEKRVDLMDRIHTSNALIDQMIHVVRRISTDLRPSVLDDLGLIAALEWQLSEFTSRIEIPHEFATTFEHVNMEEDTAVAVFRIFQEALTNVARHSRATKVAVVLREGERSLFGDESLVLEIRDNGRGITEEEILNPESLGLLGMKERVLAFGGELSFRGEPGGGTTVVLKIP